MDRSSPDLPPSHILPVIDRIPGDARYPEQGTTALDGFVASGMRTWAGEPVAVPGAVTTAFWVALGAGAGVGVWLAAVRFGGAPCSGLPCAVATWAGLDLLLVLATVCAVTLTGVAVISRGMTRLTPAPLAAALLGSGCGVVAVSGVAALVVLLLIFMTLAAAVLITVVDRF